MEEVSTNSDKDLSHDELIRLEEEEFLETILEGQKGANVGITTPLPGINKYYHGITKARYVLVGADSSVGKTTITDFLYVLSAYYRGKAEGIPVDISYYSFEISKKEKRAKWLSALLFLMHGIRVNSELIMGRDTTRKLTPEEMELVRKTIPELNTIMRSIRFIEEPIHPTAIFHDLISNARRLGTIVEKKTEIKNARGKVTETKSRILKYVPHDPKQIKLFIIDHIALCMTEQGNDLKRNIDKMSYYCVYLRNRLGYSPIIIQQFNTELASVERQKFKKGALAPQRVDFGDSKYTYRDADYVIGLLKPNMFDLEEYEGYDVSKLKDHLVMAFLMKNRYGVSNKVLPLFMDGEVSVFYQLPVPDEKAKLNSYYEKAKQLDNGNKSS